jgi:hypothetical protein
MAKPLTYKAVSRMLNLKAREYTFFQSASLNSLSGSGHRARADRVTAKSVHHGMNAVRNNPSTKAIVQKKAVQAMAAIIVPMPTWNRGRSIAMAYSLV